MERDTYMYCKKCKRMTHHKKGARFTTIREEGEKPNLDHFLIKRRLICRICERKGCEKFSRRFKSKPIENFDKEGHDWPM